MILLQMVDKLKVPKVKFGEKEADFKKKCVCVFWQIELPGIKQLVIKLRFGRMYIAKKEKKKPLTWIKGYCHYSRLNITFEPSTLYRQEAFQCPFHLL